MALDYPERIRRSIARLRISGSELLRRRQAGHCVRCDDPYPGLDADLLPNYLCAKCQQTEDEIRKQQKRASRPPTPKERAKTIDDLLDRWTR